MVEERVSYLTVNAAAQGGMPESCTGQNAVADFEQKAGELVFAPLVIPNLFDPDAPYFVSAVARTANTRHGRR